MCSLSRSSITKCLAGVTDVQQLQMCLFLNQRDSFFISPYKLVCFIRAHFDLVLDVLPPFCARFIHLFWFSWYFLSLLHAACMWRKLWCVSSSICMQYFPRRAQKCPRGERRGGRTSSSFLASLRSEYLKGRLRVIQLPRKKAPGKQAGLIIHRHHVLQRDNNIIII